MFLTLHHEAPGIRKAVPTVPVGTTGFVTR
jgi:hypothetical protein